MIKRRRGGSDGGASTLTSEGEELLEAYGRVREEIELVAREKFEESIRGILEFKKGTRQK